MDLRNNKNVNSKQIETYKVTKNLKISDDNPKVPSRKQLKRLQTDICSKICCKFCPQKTFKSIVDYQRHLNSVKHLNKLRNFNATDCWNCYICDKRLPNENEWLKHITGKHHLNQVAASALSEFSYSRLITNQEIQSFMSSSCVETEEHEFE